jgi:O-antigen ligase
MGGLIVIGAVVTVTLLSGDLSDRYLSIFSAKTKNARTAQGRLDGVYADLQVAMRRPFFGHGLGTSLEANANFGGEAQPSHNLYTQVAQELGFIGLAIFLVFLVTVSRNVNNTLRLLNGMADRSNVDVRLSRALQVWFGMNVLFSFASYGLSSYEWYFMAGLSEVLRELAQRQSAKIAPQASLPAKIPRRRLRLTSSING